MADESNGRVKGLGNILGRVGAIGWVIVMWHMIGLGLAAITTPIFLFELLNAVAICVAVAVTISYTPVFWQAVTAKRLAWDSGNLLACGIWIGWLSIILNRIFTYTWQYLGRPAWILDTDIRSYYLSLLILAGLFHLTGPEAINNSIPPGHWVKIGLLLGAATAGSLTIFWIS